MQLVFRVDPHSTEKEFLCDFPLLPQQSLKRLAVSIRPVRECDRIILLDTVEVLIYLAFPSETIQNSSRRDAMHPEIDPLEHYDEHDRVGDRVSSKMRAIGVGQLREHK